MLNASGERDVVSVSYAAPREMMPKDSPEYARRSILRLQNLWMKVDSNAEEFEAMLTELKQAHVAQRWPPDQPYGSLDALVRAALGITLAKARLRIRMAAAETSGDVQTHGGDRMSLAARARDDSSLATRLARAERSGVGLTTQKQLDRLARERPDLLKEVIAGRLKTNRAYILAGFEKERVTVPKEPAAAARLLARHFKGNALAELIAALTRASQS